jgi:uncharacterized protein (TIGR02001 family)
MQKSKLLVAVLGALCAVPVLAADAPAPTPAVTANVGIVTNYVFRGIAQASTNPAIQGGFDYAHASGFYAGLWGSNVSWIADSGAVATGSVTMELDTYLGFKKSINDDVGYDVGYIRYNYVGDYTAAAGFAKADTAEVYAAISYKFLTAKYSYSVLDQFLTVPDTKGTNYIELNANYTIPDTTYTLIGHIGKQTYTGKTADALGAAGTPATYSDYKVGVAKDFSGYVVTVAYSNTDAKEGGFYTYPATGGNWARGMTAVSLTHSF